MPASPKTPGLSGAGVGSSRCVFSKATPSGRSWPSGVGFVFSRRLGVLFTIMDHVVRCSSTVTTGVDHVGRHEIFFFCFF